VACQCDYPIESAVYPIYQLAGSAFYISQLFKMSPEYKQSVFDACGVGSQFYDNIIETDAMEKRLTHDHNMRF